MPKVSITSKTVSVVVKSPPYQGPLYINEYNGRAGTIAQGSGGLFWQSNFTTKSGTLIEWGTGDHNHFGDNGVREFNPVTKTSAYVYPNNDGSKDLTQHDNLTYFYSSNIDSLIIPARGQYFRNSDAGQPGSWIRGGDSFVNYWPNGPYVVGSGAQDLILPLGNADANGFKNGFNPHMTWAPDFNTGVVIGGGLGGNNSARFSLWFVVPSKNIGNYAQPYVLFRRELPKEVSGAAPALLSGRDGCCVLGEYVYWVGGQLSVGAGYGLTPYFFRMRLSEHLTSMTAPLEIERLEDAPASFRFGLLRADPYTNALLCVTDQGIYAYDVLLKKWQTITPAEYFQDFNSLAHFKGLLPYGSLGDFIDTCQNQPLRKFYFRTGVNHDWDYDYGGKGKDILRAYRSIQLGRK